MTGIAWKISKDQIWLVADTMLSNDKGTCCGETGKILPLLHANAMMCAVGTPYAIADWMQFLICGEVVASLSELNTSASAFLRHRYPLRYQKHPINECLLYQFGVDADGAMAGYLLKQPDFEPAKLPDMGSEPELENLPEVKNKDVLRNIIIELNKKFPNVIGCSIDYANLRKGQILLQRMYEFGNTKGLLKEARKNMVPTTHETIGDSLKAHEHFNLTGEFIVNYPRSGENGPS
jgi:hypothetical protein